MCCNPANGRVEFEDGWVIKPNFITMDEMKACQLTRTKLKKKMYSSNNLYYCFVTESCQSACNTIYEGQCNTFHYNNKDKTCNLLRASVQDHVK
jgi:hypothetical protein